MILKSRRKRADLSERPDFLLDLLSDSNVWKQRAVTEFAFEAANHVRVSSSFQIEFPPDLIERYVDTRFTRRANILLPVVAKTKDALLNFNLRGPEGSPATLLPRVSIAGLQADYLQGLATSSSAERVVLSHGIYDAISVFTPFTFRTRFLRRWARGPGAERPFEKALRSYLEDGLGFQVGAADISRWRARTRSAGEILSRRLDEPADPLSSSEEILLAAPLIEPPPATVTDLDRLVERYVEHVEIADAANDDAYLSVLSEYGRRYELICEVEVPLLEPFRIKVEEDQPLGLKRRGRMMHALVVGGSKSMHIEAQTVDSNVVLGRKMSLRDTKGHDISGRMELIRITPERLALYSSDRERPYIAVLSLRLRTAFQLTFAAALLTMISLAATIVVLTLPEDRFFISSLGVLAVPTTVASAFVLTREDSPLATRLQRAWRGALALASLALWFVLVLRLTGYEAPQQTPTQKSSATAAPSIVKGTKGATDGTQRGKRQRTSRSSERPQPEP
jgi:hypothetical protein